MELKFIITALIQLIHMGAFIWGALYLKEKIKHKNSQIDTLTKNFDEVSKMLNLYKVKEFEEYVAMMLKTKDMKHDEDKAELEKLANFKFSEDNPEFIKVFDQIRADWAKKQAELLQLVGYFLLQIDNELREQVLSTIPLSRSLIEDVIEKIENTKK